MVSRQLFGEQLAEMSGGAISSVQELVAAAQAGQAAASQVAGLQKEVAKQEVAHKEMLERQRVQEEALRTLREERQQMQESMETNGRVLGEQIREAQTQTLAQTQPLLLSIMAKLGIAQPAAGSAAGSSGGGVGADVRPMEVEGEVEGGEAAAPTPSGNGGGAGAEATAVDESGGAGSGGAPPVASARAPATGSGTTPPVESALALVPLTAPRGGVASATGAVRRERAPLGGLDHMLAETQRTEAELERLQRRLAALDEEWRQAMVVEAQALDKEETAREAVEACVLGAGEDVQGAHLAAMEASAEASGAVETLARRRQAVEGAVERAKEENRRAGEDTRNEQAKRKRQVAKGSDEKRQGDGRKEGDEEPTA